MNIVTVWDEAWRRGRRTKLFVRLMTFVNLGFALVNVFFWSYMALVMADPISWATWSSVGGAGARPGMFEYPFIVLWALPVVGTIVAIINNVLGFRTAARVAAAFPLTLLGLTVCWWAVFQDSML
jgi:hypothetical protein